MSEKFKKEGKMKVQLKMKRLKRIIGCLIPVTAKHFFYWGMAMVIMGIIAIMILRGFIGTTIGTVILILGFCLIASAGELDYSSQALETLRRKLCLK